MILDIYMKFEKLGKNKSKERFDLTDQSQIYESIFSPNKKGDVWVYLYNNTDFINTNTKRKPNLVLCGRAEHLSGIYISDPDFPLFAYGDTKGTEDALLFLFERNMEWVEIFVAKGKKNIVNTLCNLFLDSELDDEIKELRKMSKQITA